MSEVYFGMPMMHFSSTQFCTSTAWQQILYIYCTFYKCNVQGHYIHVITYNVLTCVCLLLSVLPMPIITSTTPECLSEDTNIINLTIVSMYTVHTYCCYITCVY